MSSPPFASTFTTSLVRSDCLCHTWGYLQVPAPQPAAAAAAPSPPVDDDDDWAVDTAAIQAAVLGKAGAASLPVSIAPVDIQAAGGYL